MINLLSTFQGKNNVEDIFRDKNKRRFIADNADIGHLEVFQHYNIIPGEACWLVVHFIQNKIC